MEWRPVLATPMAVFDTANWSDDDPERTEGLAFLVSLRRDRLADGGVPEWRGTVQERRSSASTRVCGWGGVMAAMRRAEAGLWRAGEGAE